MVPYWPASPSTAMPVGNGASGSPPQAGLADLEAHGSTPPVTGRSLCKVFLLRLVVRLALLGLVLLLAQFVDIRSGVNRYCAWVELIGQQSLREAVALYALGGTVFATLSPTGYLPTVLAGALFPWYVAWPLSYAVTNLGAFFNLVLVRGPCHPVARKLVHSHARLQQGSGFGAFGWLDAELRRSGAGAWSVVALVRLPYLWTGLFNYIFALSSVRGRAYLVGNAIGLLPGSLLFSLLGAQAQSLLSMVASTSAGSAPKDEITLVGIEVVCLLGALAALSVYFRRAWKQKAEKEAITFGNADTYGDERVALLGDTGEVIAEAGEEGLGFLGIGEPVDPDDRGLPFGRETMIQAQGGEVRDDYFRELDTSDGRSDCRLASPTRDGGGPASDARFSHSPSDRFGAFGELGASRPASPGELTLEGSRPVSPSPVEPRGVPQG